MKTGSEKGRTAILWTVTILWICLCLLLPWQPGEETAALSGKITLAVYRVIRFLGFEVEITILHAALRKLAHPAVFFVENSIYDHIIYDSQTIERPFAQALDEDPDVKLFLRLPIKFKIDTSIGTYNPDWAVYVDKDGEKRLYFVIETKGATQMSFLRGNEEGKILCGKKHFKALGNDVRFCAPVKDWVERKDSQVRSTLRPCGSWPTAARR